MFITLPYDRASNLLITASLRRRLVVTTTQLKSVEVPQRGSRSWVDELHWMGFRCPVCRALQPNSFAATSQ
jgi:hypothetical protein